MLSSLDVNLKGYKLTAYQYPCIIQSPGFRLLHKFRLDIMNSETSYFAFQMLKFQICAINLPVTVTEHIAI